MKSNTFYIPFFNISETTYTAALTYMSGTTLGFGLDDIRKTSDMEKIIVSVFNQVIVTAPFNIFPSLLEDLVMI